MNAARKRTNRELRSTPIRVESTVVIVDANNERRHVLSELLVADGLNVLHAMSGNHAAKMLLVEDIDLLITGVLLPDMDGLELLQIAKAIASQRPVIVLSDGQTRIHEIYLRSARVFGASATFASPVEPKAVRDSVHQHLAPRTRKS